MFLFQVRGYNVRKVSKSFVFRGNGKMPCIAQSHSIKTRAIAVSKGRLELLNPPVRCIFGLPQALSEGSVHHPGKPLGVLQITVQSRQAACWPLPRNPITVESLLWFLHWMGRGISVKSLKKRTYYSNVSQTIVVSDSKILIPVRKHSIKLFSFCHAFKINFQQ